MKFTFHFSLDGVPVNMSSETVTLVLTPSGDNLTADMSDAVSGIVRFTVDPNQAAHEWQVKVNSTITPLAGKVTVT